MKARFVPAGSAPTPCSSSAFDTYLSAAPRAARAVNSSSANRRRFSIRASFSMLGHAHSSPIVSGATR